MFEALRRMILPIIIIVLFFFLGMIVLQWGLDLNRSGPGGPRANVAGVINGEEVPWGAFSQTFNNLLQNERAQRGADYEIPDDRARQLERQAWQQLVADRVIKQEASRLGITVSDTDVYDYLKYNPPQYLRQEPMLITDGQFDYQKYLGLMADPQAGPLWADIYPRVSEDLKRLKMAQYVSSAAHVTEDEVKQAFLDAREQVTVGLVNAPLNQFLPVVPEATDEELQTYFSQHRDDYPVDERVILDIVKIGKDPSTFDEESAQALAKEIYDSVTTGSDFEEFARIYSDDPGSGAAGGDMGWFSTGRMVKEFDSAAFVMEDGDISTPIKTAFGWHVLKHHGYRDQEQTVGGKEETVREAHVSHILVRVKASAETLEDAWQQLDLIRSESENVGFAAAAETEGLEVITTDPVAADGYVTQISTSAQTLTWAFETELGDVSEVMDLPNLYCVVRLSDRLPAGLAELADIETQVKRDYRNEKLAQTARDTIQMVYDETHQGTSLKDAAERFELSYEALAPFARTSTVAKIGSDPVIIGTAFGLRGNGAVTRPLDYATGTAMVELLNRTSPELTEYNDNRDSVYDATLLTKQQAAYRTWYTQLIDKADVESNVDFTSRR
jgi:hypothetical protein